MKNIEMLRKMTDEELEDWINEITQGNEFWFNETLCISCKKKNGGKCPAGGEGCVYGEDSIHEWLYENSEE